MSINVHNKYAVLLAVAESGSLTAAGERTGYTQSAVSRIIIELEDECGFPLLVRGKTGSRLTKEGAELLAPIRAVLNAEEQLDQTIAQLNGLRRGRVRVGMFSSVAVHWAPGLIEQFNAKYPDITVTVFDGLYHEIENKMLMGELDCGFLTMQTKKALNFTELSHDRLLAVIPKEHALSKLPALPLELIPSVDFIIPGEGSNYDIGQIFKEHGITPKARYAFSDDHAAIAMVERGMGITILPELVLKDCTADVKLTPLSHEFSRTIGIALPNSPERHGVSPAARTFVDFVSGWVKGMKRN